MPVSQQPAGNYPPNSGNYPPYPGSYPPNSAMMPPAASYPAQYPYLGYPYSAYMPTPLTLPPLVPISDSNTTPTTSAPAPKKAPPPMKAPAPKTSGPARKPWAKVEELEPQLTIPPTTVPVGVDASVNPLMNKEQE